MNGTPAAAVAAIAASTSGSDRLIGFSQNTALPAAAALIISSLWVEVAVQIANASTAGEASSSSILAAASTPNSAATLAALSAEMS